MQACPPVAPLAPQSHFFRDLFAQTIAAVLQTSSFGLLATITGRIMQWFTRKGANSASPYAPQYPGYSNTGYPSAAPGYPSTPFATNPAGGCPAPAQAYAPTGPYPSQTPGYQTPPGYPTPAGYSTTPGYPTAANYSTTPGYPSAANYSTTPGYPTVSGNGTTSAYPSTPSYTTTPGYPTTPAQTPSNPSTAQPPQVYDARTGQPVPADANPYTTRGLPAEGTLYAGIAYEVHTLAADGTYSIPVNTATYDFHTGDKFMVYYRPSLPGHMEIYNINAAGKQTLIDSSNMPAGEMVTLGPYQFTNDSGEESLRLVLSPCSNPQLLTATRDIVKVDAIPQASPNSVAQQLGDCGAPAPRGLDIKTRDIEKVGVEGSTSFALDPVSPKELKSGQLTPRQMTIVFHHR
jgi:hypothetical protein